MKFWEYYIAWKYSSENWEIGIVKAESKEQAEKLVRDAKPSIIFCDIYDTIDDLSDNEVYTLYSR